MQASLDKLTHWITEHESIFVASKTPIANNPFYQSTLDINNHYHGNPRLGFIYQEQCRLLFEASQHYQVIAEEIQLIEGNQTIGAIDFIIENRGDIEHWEVAVKFYLLHENQWYGPDSRDRLDLKLDRMLNHQLKMSSTTAFKQRYPELDIISHHLLMQGRLYTNPFEQSMIPKTCLDYPINADCIEGFWCYQHQVGQIEETLYPLDKIDWLAGNTDQDKPFNANKPLIYTVHCQASSGQFWMIVPNNWPLN